jgi:pimeloyl-ACP methyl ester carboxylesterase
MRDVFSVDANGVVDYDCFKDRFGEGLLPLMRKWHPKDDEQMREFVQQSLTMWLTYGERTREQIETVQTPALVIVGDRDEHVPVEEAVRLYRWLPNAELAILPGTSHMRPLFDAATFADCVTDFMRRH